MTTKRNEPYVTPEVGAEFPAQPNLTVNNPGPTQSTTEMNEWLQASAQDTAYQKNLVLVEEYTNAQKDSPEYALKLGVENSYWVKVIAAEAGGITFDLQRIGPLVRTLPQETPAAPKASAPATPKYEK